MANEIQFEYRIGATLTYGAYEPDGSVRTAAATSLPEIAATGYYTVSDANIAAGDAVVVKEATTVVGGGTYQPEATVSNISDIQSGLATEAKQDIIDAVVDRTAAIQEGDEDFDYANGTVEVFPKGTTSGGLLKKNLYDKNDDIVADTEAIIARTEDVTP